MKIQKTKLEQFPSEGSNKIKCGNKAVTCLKALQTVKQWLSSCALPSVGHLTPLPPPQDFTVQSWLVS